MLSPRGQSVKFESREGLKRITGAHGSDSRKWLWCVRGQSRVAAVSKSPQCDWDVPGFSLPRSIYKQMANKWRRAPVKIVVIHIERFSRNASPWLVLFKCATLSANVSLMVSKSPQPPPGRSLAVKISGGRDLRKKNTAKNDFLLIPGDVNYSHSTHFVAHFCFPDFKD